MREIEVIEVGRVEPEVFATVAAAVERVFGLPVRRGAVLPEPADAFDAGRGQYSSSEILKRVLASRSEEAVRSLGVTRADLFIPMLTFVYGQAQLDGPVALVSTARLRQEFYGLPGDRELLLERLEKEVIHELGHTFGLVHCADRVCTMSLASKITRVDEKAAELCAGCSALLRQSLKAAVGETGGRMESHR